MTHAALFHTYLRHYAGKNLDAIANLLAEDVHLRDWNVSVFGKAEALRDWSQADLAEKLNVSRQTINAIKSTTPACRWHSQLQNSFK